MKTAAFLLLIGLLLLTFQATLLSFPFIQRIRPDLILIFVLFLGLFYTPVSGGIIAFLLGFLMDLYSGNSLGLHTLSRTLIFYLAQFLRGRLYLEGFSSQFFFVFLFAVFEAFFILILLKILSPNPTSHLYPLLFTLFLPRSFFTALLGAVLFSLVSRGSFQQAGAGEGG
ncbi:MAG: rod shape-determining protein MreD [Deltaproteobacteria bacterium RBG_13_53_10]|nr:MAG: rod shape-determining protein MreD [Deltaproteobacteria bacterium RBG_13_53_10]